MQKKKLNVDNIIQEQINSIKAINKDGIEEAVSAILECNGKIVVTGMGKAGLIGRKISATLSSTGTPSIFMHPAEAQHGDLGLLDSSDMILALSNSGRTREIIESCFLAKDLFPNIKIITITSNKESDLATNSSIVIETGAYPEVCPLGMAPTSSTTAMLVIGDIISMLVMQEKEVTLKEYSMRHHGGYLGYLAKLELDKK